MGLSRESTPMFETPCPLMGSPENLQTLKKSQVIFKNCLRFHVISSTEHGALTRLSPFAIFQKAIGVMVCEPKSANKI